MTSMAVLNFSCSLWDVDDRDDVCNGDGIINRGDVDNHDNWFIDRVDDVELIESLIWVEETLDVCDNGGWVYNGVLHLKTLFFAFVLFLVWSIYLLMLFLS